MNNYISNLGPKIENFIKFKNSLGIEYKTSSFYLKQLDIYNMNHGNKNSLTKKIIEGWALEHDAKSITCNRSWIPPIREFGRYLQSIGDDNAYILDHRFKIQHYHAEVYLMADKEIQLFFKECDKFVLKFTTPGRPYVLPALYRLLYCCGARCGEARKLKCENVSLKKGYLDILQSKGNRDRRLYLSEELINYLSEYDKAIKDIFHERIYFFPSPQGDMCSSQSLSVNFKNIWKSAGLNYDGNPKVRAFDFRHHFACSNIMRWSKDGKDIHAKLPYLMRYMGHTTIESTYYYIHLIPDFFPQYSKLVASTEDLIPEVEEYEI
jgi:integrase